MARGRAVGYARVSSLNPNTARQLDGLALDEVFSDTGNGDETARPGLAALLEYLRKGDTLYVDSMDRLGRDLAELFRLVAALMTRSISVVFVRNGLALSGSARATEKLMLAMLGAVIESEREMTRERQAAGIARARSRGAYKDRRPPKLSIDQLVKARSQIEGGMQKSLVARELHVSRTTLYMNLKKAAATRARRG